MNILSDHIRYTTRTIDAFLDQYTLGTLIIENQTVLLLLENNDEIQLDDSFIIEVFDGSQYHTITYEQAINTYCSDAPEWHLFAGFEARVKRKEVA
ncbi:hypothetical protein [Anoxybacillus sp. ST4]|uniref:hypothetical protein n=1 Tax=Anoxybacillus sp. ST4 TaxID=2864181 RepID=UPI001C641130|nr:hypothetical protein [Anoxybacillus sp. ST4]MBW7649817.1 hypothetical protein [Anoxybacillus sp. ST4]